MKSQPRERAWLGRPTRFALVGLAFGLAAVLGLARWLEPDPRGYGTHTQLGLAPCAFAQVTGERCPACGATTAFAWVVPGPLARTWRAQPARGPARPPRAVVRPPAPV